MARRPSERSIASRPSRATSVGSETLGESFLTRPIALESATFAQVREVFNNPATKTEPSLLNDCAAVVLQCMFRKYLAGKEAKRRRALRKRASVGVAESFVIAVPPLPPCPDEAASGNGHAESSTGVTGDEPESDVSDEEAGYGLLADIAATVIQTKMRQVLAKKRVRLLLKKRNEEFAKTVNDSLEHCAAITVQTAHRRFSATKRVRQIRMEKDGLNISQDSRREPSPEPAALPTQSREEPLRFSRKRQQRVGDTSVTTADALKTRAMSAATNPEGGKGLSALFYDATAALLDRRAFVTALWGVRILHAAAMDVKSRDRLPLLEASRWVQGPLSAIIPSPEVNLAAGPPARSLPVNSSLRPTSAGRAAKLDPIERSPSRPGSGNALNGHSRKPSHTQLAPVAHDH